ncbi:MAG: hypothetical protein V4519_05155 [Patescibacteria group bacterium]
MIDIHTKDWVNHLIVALGILVGIALLYGMITTLKPVLGIKSNTPEYSSATSCKKCITIAQNNTSKTVQLSETITIELPEDLYPEANLTALQNPANILKKIGQPSPKGRGNWAAEFQVVKKGMADIIVKSSTDTVSDFRFSLIVE